MKLVKLTAVSAAVLASSVAMAGNVVTQTGAQVIDGTKTVWQTATHPAAVSAEVGTLGYGANIAWGLNERTELQAGWAGGDVSKMFGGDVDINDVNYDVESDFSNPYLGVQLRPAANWFTVGAGIIVPKNDFDVTANPKPGEEFAYYEIDGVKYNAQQVGQLKGTIEHRNKLAPYGTIGFRPNINSQWGVFGEVGAAYLGKTSATVTAANGEARTDQGLTANQVAEKAEQQIESKNYMEWMPIAKVGVTYRF